MDELNQRDDLAGWQGRFEARQLAEWKARLEERVLAPLRGTGWRYYAWLAFLLVVLGWALYA
jgi:hypothetical protein